jgi:hypothetical protein
MSAANVTDNRTAGTTPMIVTKTAATGRTLTPGAYVVGRQVSNSGLGWLGTHQFIVLIPEKDYASMGHAVQDLGNGLKGIVVAAYDVDDRLEASYFGATDCSVLRGYLQGTGGTRGVHQVNLATGSARGRTIDQSLQLILSTVDKYIAKQSARAPAYPNILGQFAPGCLNSNSWAQSVIQTAIGKGAVVADFEGLDTCHEDRLSADLFK